MPSFESTRTRAEVVNDCRKFVGQFDEDDLVTYALLTSYQGPADDFLILRRSVWPDSRFYHPDFLAHRMYIAAGIACNLNNTWVDPAMCRSVLGLDNYIPLNSLDLGVRDECGLTLMHGLAQKVGEANERGNAREWHNLIRDVVKYVPDIRDLSQCGYFEMSSEGVWQTMTPLLMLVRQALSARMSPFRHHVAISSTQSAAVLAGCEKSIFAWLSDLYDGGIDLLLYGRNEKQHFRDPSCLPEGVTNAYFSMSYEHIWLGKPVYRYHVRLINFHYGRLPTDWRFWWSEPSDEFAGDFWCLVESDSQEAAMSVPGAWVD